MPLHTGDVNEYRSPMQDGFRPAGVSVPAYGGGSFAARGRPRGRAFNNDGNYRAPSFQDRGDARGGGGERPRPSVRTAGPAAEPSKARSEKRSRPMFAITCKSCGTESQVPFKPDEDRDVFCQACYRARKPGQD